MALGRDGNALDRSRYARSGQRLQHYVPVWKHTGTKTHPTASLLAKPTPINTDSGSDRFAMFNIVGTSPSSIA
jgi:hypothetical protein